MLIRESIKTEIARSERPGAGLLVALLLLGAVECWLHTDSFLLKFRSVFAAGRAMDKVVYVKHHRPELLILGNSRADNSFRPGRCWRMSNLSWNVEHSASAFRGPICGVLSGIVERLDHAAVFGEGRNPNRPAYPGRVCCRRLTRWARTRFSPALGGSGRKASFMTRSGRPCACMAMQTTCVS